MTTLTDYFKTIRAKLDEMESGLDMGALKALPLDRIEAHMRGLIETCRIMAERGAAQEEAVVRLTDELNRQSDNTIRLAAMLGGMAALAGAAHPASAPSTERRALLGGSAPLALVVDNGPLLGRVANTDRPN